jgi:pimeloyl-ACP methyl ester carboxylesterase
MNLAYAALAFVAALFFVLVGLTRTGAWLIERRYPPVGEFADIAGTRIHYRHVPPPFSRAPAVVFLHGASSNLNDQMLPLKPLLEGKAEMLFFDRPGHGWSDRGSTNEDPAGQAATVAALMDHLGIERAILVGHSLGAATATAFALDHPGRTAGLVLLSSATHPWPGGTTSWYYSLTATPVVGWLFSEAVSLPAGWLRMPAATTCVFAPNPVPDNYLDKASIGLVLRPSVFRANAVDVEGLYRYAVETAPRYKDISAPTIVISGDSDTVVYEEIHSAGLARDIAGAEIVWIRNLGHKSDWIASELAAGAVLKLAGQAVELEAMAREVEARVRADRSGSECADPKPMLASGQG